MPEAETKMPAAQSEVEFAKCECCGLTEECTTAYIARVRERYHGFWICGLCAEAVKDEIHRAGRFISTEEALDRHMSFSRDFRFRAAVRPPVESGELLISSMRQLLHRSLYSPRAMRSTPGSPSTGEDGEEEGEEDAGSQNRPMLRRSGRCFPTIAG